MASFQAKIGRKMVRNRKKKIIVPIRSYPKRNRNFHKISKKMQKCHYGFNSSQNRLEYDEKYRK